MELSSSKANNSVKTSTKSLNRHIAKLANRQIDKSPNQQIGISLSYRQTSQRAIVAIARHLFL